MWHVRDRIGTWLFGVLAVLILTASLQGADAKELATTEPLFSRHVVPLLSRLGCNAGICHGAVQGQNGFRLTLFGADPTLDYSRMVREFGGRRLNRTDPDSSLLLLKASGLVAHQGGKRTNSDSREYQLIRDWIARGARLDESARSQLQQLRVTPAQQTIKAGEIYQLRVEATFADRSVEDVTGLCTFESVDQEVAAVDQTGKVVARSRGDSALIVRYRSDPVVAHVVVSGSGTEPFPAVPENNFIDQHVLAKLKLLSILPSDLCDDATFLQRASLDVTGELPAPEEIRAFLADKNPNKRARKADELLDRPGHALVWATTFCDLLKPSYRGDFGFAEPAEVRRFHEWIRARLQENLPYDQLVERILIATSREGRPAGDWIAEIHAIIDENAKNTHELNAYSQRKTLDLYWQRPGATGVRGTVQLAHAFLGLRLECAQCHRHPHDIWQQDDLLSFANFFQRVSNGSTPEMAKAAEPLTKESKEFREQSKKLLDQAKDKKLSKEEADRLRIDASDLDAKARAKEEAGKRLRSTEIHVTTRASPASVSSPLGTLVSSKYRLLGEAKAVDIPADQDPRAVVVAWLRQPDNPFFARAIVNRIWAHYLGRGIVDPPDHLSPLNPPTHPQLLDELAQGFVKSGYDLKWVHRAILNSRTYQLDSRTNASNRLDTRNYASFYRRRLSAELLVDAINHATGGQESYPQELRLPPGVRAIGIAGEMKADARDSKASALAYALNIFGRPQRSPDVQCDCERDTAPTIVQLLYLANHPAVRAKINADDGRPAQVARQSADDARRVEEVFLWTVCRLPTMAEQKTCQEHLKASASLEKGLQGIMWSLLNTREFLLIH